MLSAVQNYNVSPKHLAFKGKNENTDTNTNAGLKTGAVWAGICLLYTSPYGLEL